MKNKKPHHEGEKGVSTRSQVSNLCGYTAFVSQIEIRP